MLQEQPVVLAVASRTQLAALRRAAAAAVEQALFHGRGRLFTVLGRERVDLRTLAPASVNVQTSLTRFGVGEAGRPERRDGFEDAQRVLYENLVSLSPGEALLVRL